MHSSSNIIRVIKSRRKEWAGHVASMGEPRNVNKIYTGKSEGKRLLQRPRRRWNDNIKTYSVEIGCEHVDWILLAQDRVQ
jgi:hypothetical protein